MTSHADPIPPDAPERRVNRNLSEASIIALRGLFAAEGRTLLQMLFAWRAQGSLTRWSTGPSKALALFVDFVQREYPSASAAAGTKDLDFERASICCDYEDCDQNPTVKLSCGQRMCEHHAAVSLLAGMSADDARSTFKFARPVPEDPWARDGT